MPKKTFVDSFGNTQDVTLRSALGPLPDDIPVPRYQPQRFWKPTETTPREPSGYSNPVDDPAYLAEHWGHR